MGDRGEVRSAMEYLHGNIVTGDVSSFDPDSTAMSLGGAMGASERTKGNSSTKNSRIGKNEKKTKKTDKTEANVSEKNLCEAKVVNRQTFEGCNDLNFEKNSQELQNTQNKNLNIIDNAHKVACTGSDVTNVEASKVIGDQSTQKLLTEKESTGSDLPTEVANTTRAQATQATHQIFKMKQCPGTDVTKSKSDVASAQSDRQVLTKEQLELEIRAFLLAEDTDHMFGAELTAQERFYVHTIAEELNIEHESKGEGEQRYIVVRKRTNQAVIGKTFGILFLVISTY